MRPRREKGGKNVSHAGMRAWLQDEGVTERKIGEHLNATGEQQSEGGNGP